MQGVAAKNDASYDLSRARASVTGQTTIAASYRCATPAAYCVRLGTDCTWSRRRRKLCTPRFEVWTREVGATLLRGPLASSGWRVATDPLVLLQAGEFVAPKEAGFCCRRNCVVIYARPPGGFRGVRNPRRGIGVLTIAGTGGPSNLGLEPTAKGWTWLNPHRYADVTRCRCGDSRRRMHS